MKKERKHPRRKNSHPEAESSGQSARPGAPLQPHQHWHIDVSYINLCGTFYNLGSVLDGFSRFLVHWDLRE
jgi:transposase InsO family protein